MVYNRDELSKALIGTLYKYPEMLELVESYKEYLSPLEIAYVKILRNYCDRHKTKEFVLPLIWQEIQDGGLQKNLLGYLELAEASGEWIKIFLEDIKKDWLKRQRIKTAGELLKEVKKEEDVEPLMEKIKEYGWTPETQPITFYDIAKGVVEDIVANIGKPYEFETHLRDFNELTGGFHRGELSILAGQTSIGKTALALGFALHFASVQQKKVLFNTLEMADGVLIKRFISMHKEIALSPPKDRMLKEKDIKILKDTVEQFFKGCDIQLIRAFTITEMREQIRNLKPDIFMVDYLQLVIPVKKDTRNLEIGETVRGLKNIATEFNIPVLLLSQLRRIDRQPTLNDLRDSGEIEQASDSVCLMYWERNTKTKREVDVNLAKNRNGQVGTFKLTFIPKYMQFQNHTPQKGGI